MYNLNLILRGKSDKYKLRPILQNNCSLPFWKVKIMSSKAN